MQSGFGEEYYDDQGQLIEGMTTGMSGAAGGKLSIEERMRLKIKTNMMRAGGKSGGPGGAGKSPGMKSPVFKSGGGGAHGGPAGGGKGGQQSPRGGRAGKEAPAGLNKEQKKQFVAEIKAEFRDMMNSVANHYVSEESKTLNKKIDANQREYKRDFTVTIEKFEAEMLVVSEYCKKQVQKI